jgi:hypothetical protein
MNSHRILVALAIILLAIRAVNADDKSANPQEQLETAIPEAIRLLKAKEYKTFCETFSAPDDLKKAKSSPYISYDELLKDFENQKAANVLLALERAKDIKPELSNDGTSAKYVLSDEKFSGPRSRELNFIKVDNLWYIKDR